jgi:hypothetical protein
MRRLCSTCLVLLLIVFAVVPAWSAGALADCCVRKQKAGPDAQREHEHCDGMRMAAQDAAPDSNEDHLSSAVTKFEPICRCAMTMVSGVVALHPSFSKL